ncbi:glycosyl transferase family protein [Bifidobacterium margollesii]|uniref:Glycosyl transferase family protein n=1 Tax=Bifidobacterium margollesii TaxID=2020964 RepID=A0A2N5J6X8_9BIFI|nr:glycosyltransferase family 2 protein [Bifidobacterium margollesii]PLS29965.1 glycosyl transferase family protein [Bifidobacterium margollesii]
MLDNHTLSLIMPCRNEEGHLASLINAVPAFYDEIILVCNASTDGTYRLARSLESGTPRLRTIRDDRTINGIGYGFAHMTGIDAASGDIIVCADSDGTYPIDDVPRILDDMTRRNLAFVSCSRYPADNIPWKLQLGVRTLNAEILMLYGLRLHDSLSGMWVFHRSVVPSLHLTEGDWNLSPQIKLNAYRYLGRRFGEVRIRQRVRSGSSKQRYLVTGLRHLIWIAKNRFTPQV